MNNGGVAEWLRQRSAKPFTAVRIRPHTSWLFKQITVGLVAFTMLLNDL
jgi:hypothetical protein